jgi:hypothetical protein
MAKTKDVAPVRVRRIFVIFLSLPPPFLATPESLPFASKGAVFTAGLAIAEAQPSQ